MQNVTTLATRIRIDVLFMIARTYTKDGENLFVKQFISKPVLLVKSKDKFEYALTFTDAVQRYGGQIKESDFSSIYKRIGAAFPDQLEQTFVVLGEGGGWTGRSMAQHPVGDLDMELDLDQTREGK